MSNLLKNIRFDGQTRFVHRTATIDPKLDSLNESSDAQSVEKTLQQKIEAAKHEAEQIIQKAQARAEAVEQQAVVKEQEAEHRRADAFQQKVQEGYETGFNKGTNEAAAHYAALIEQGNQFIDQAHTVYDDAIQKAAPDILRMSIAIAEKIVNVSLAEDKKKWQGLVAKAIQEVRDQEKIKIIVAPLHFDFLNQSRQILQQYVQDAKLYIYADPDFAENDCIIETAFGKIDAGVDSQLQVIKKRLTELMEEKER